MEAWDREVCARDLGVGVALGHGREVLDQHDLGSLYTQTHTHGLRGETCNHTFLRVQYIFMGQKGMGYALYIKLFG
jgi:hypothetical protein